MFELCFIAQLTGGIHHFFALIKFVFARAVFPLPFRLRRFGVVGCFDHRLFALNALALSISPDQLFSKVKMDVLR